ncbi:MAG TPA: YeeE/YedE thiosulfate transporter family protein [Bacillota bacterium]|nr:YeeE/YedE thiosulfate transporter family protein [Bacillota bacterium]
MNLQENKYFKKIVKDSWPYVTGAILLALLNIAFFVLTNGPWGVTTPFSYWGAWIVKAVGVPVEKWGYFAGPHNFALKLNFLNHGGSLLNLGIIVGALLASLAASQFKIKKIKSVSQVVAAISGGLLMGYGARIAFGCNIGALFSGIASSSLHGWVYLVFMFVGAWIGSKLLVKFFM